MDVEASLVKKTYKKRDDWCHKGDFGKLLVVGGSIEYSGSPILNALAALRAGVDLVRIAAPESTANAIKAYSPDLIAIPLQGNYLSRKHIPIILEMQKDADAMVIGGGLTRNKDVLDAIQELIEKTIIPVVIDADAIYAIKSKFKNETIITPHSHEFSVLYGKEPTKDIEVRKIEAREIAQRFACTVLLKGHVDVISNSISTMTNRTGSSYMTKGGTGDVLAGICGALLARGVNAFDAARIAAYLNGKAGSMAAEHMGDGLLASDILDYIVMAIKKP